jgi:hypothetical protein
VIGNILGNILAAIIYTALVALAVRLVAYYFNERPLTKIGALKGNGTRGNGTMKLLWQ